MFFYLSQDFWKIVLLYFFGFLEVFLVFLFGPNPKTSGKLFFFFRGFFGFLEFFLVF